MKIKIMDNNEKNKIKIDNDYNDSK